MSNVASDFNLSKITTKELSENIRATIEFGGNLVVVGRRGSGKTCIAKDEIAASGCKELYLNMSVMERADFAGFPNILDASSKSNFVSYKMPYYFRDLIEGNQPVVAVLDEVDKAAPELTAPLLEFTQFRTMNGTPFPNLKAVVMTGNLTSEGGQRPSLPLLDRSEKYLLEPTHQHWLDWASKSGQIHPSVTAYVADHPEDLFGDVDPGDIYADPSPRGWHNASKILNFGERQRWAHKILTDKVAGSIGKKVGIKYGAYFDHYQILLPIIERIMKGEKIAEFKTLEPSKQMVACMITCARLARIIDQLNPSDKTKPVVVRTVGNFMKNVDPEMVLICIRSQIGLERAVIHGLDDDESWDAILTNLSKRVNN